MRIDKHITAASLLALLLAAGLQAGAGNRTWQTGRLVAVEISANGQYYQNKSRTPRRDIWWTYTLCTKDRTYFAVSRESPARIGLTVAGPVRFSAEKDRLYFLDPQGKEHMLRIIRQDKEKFCQ